MTDIFLSYARGDAATARRFAEAFQAEGLAVWWDYILQTGEVFDEAIENALRSARAVVVLWSPSSVASRWVRAEATIADRKGTLLPATIVPCERPIVFELTQTADLSSWNGDRSDPAWLAFLGHVRRFVQVRTPDDLAAAAVPPRPPSAELRSTEQPSILILPFVNMSGDIQQDYFSDGVSEDIITDLGRIARLSVVSRNTAFSFKGQTVAPEDLARRLGVTHILEGSVRRAGERVRITAQLFDAASDTQVWAERFDRTLDDIFAIQDEISQAIAAALEIRLAPEERRALAQRETSNSEAYEIYLMARNFSRTGSERNKPLIVRICRRAVELDPNFARAWALMASAESEMAQRQVSNSSNDRAREYAERAVKLDPTIPDGHAAMAEVIFRSGISNRDEAQKHVAAALAIDPDCYEALIVKGYIELANHDFEGAVPTFEHAISIEPDDHRASSMVMQAYEALGDTANIEAAAKRLISRAEKVLATEPDHGAALGHMVTCNVALGQKEATVTWVKRALLFDPGNARMRYNLACGLALSGQSDMAIDLLTGVIDEVDKGYLEWIQCDSDLDVLRSEPAFIALMERVRAKLAEEG